MKFYKNKMIKFNPIMIGLYIVLMLVWSLFGTPITVFVATKLPAREKYCCMFVHVVEYGLADTITYDDEWGLGVIYSNSVQNFGDNEGKSIKELEELGYRKSIQTGGAQIYLSFGLVIMLGLYNLSTIFRHKNDKLKYRLIKAALCIGILFVVLYALISMAVYLY